MSRALPESSKNDGNDAFRPWKPERLVLRFALQFETRALIENKRASQSFDPCLDVYCAKHDLSRCLVERVSCQPVGSKNSIVSRFPCSVSVHFGDVVLEPVVRNAPCGGCPLYRGTRDATTVHEWSTTQAEFDECKRFGNFTAANLAKHGSTLDGTKGTVTLPPGLARLAHEHLSRGLGRTERTPDPTDTYDVDVFEKELKGFLLGAVSHVGCRFVDASSIGVDLIVDETCDLSEFEGKDATVSVVVEAVVWCERANA